MIVRAVQIDQPGAEFLQNGKIAGTSIDKLASGGATPLRGDGPFKNQLTFLAGIDAGFLQ